MKKWNVAFSLITCTFGYPHWNKRLSLICTAPLHVTLTRMVSVSIVTIRQHDMIIKFFLRCCVSLVNFSYWFKLHVDIITGSGLWQFSFIRNWREIQKSQILSSEFCPISGDRGKSGILNLAGIRYWNVPECTKMSGFQLLPFLSY